MALAPDFLPLRNFIYQKKLFKTKLFLILQRIFEKYTLDTKNMPIFVQSRALLKKKKKKNDELRKKYS